jgi:phosphate transport system substrate-binding protein
MFQVRHESVTGRSKDEHMLKAKTILVAAAALALATGGCGKKQGEEGGGETAGGGAPTGDVIRIDGSSTVFPITQAVAEEYQAKHGGKVTIGVSGTGGGFKKFCRGETVISGASRPIKDSEVKLCAENSIEWIELPVAYDGLAVVVHKNAAWVDHMTVDELKRMWEPEAQDKITKWSQIRVGWPDKDLHLFGAGVDSGTYDYFTAAIVGKEHASRGDFTSSEDDNVLVQGISTDEAALGFFGFAYYVENQDKLKLVPIDGGHGPVAPSLETVKDGTYQPLSRPIFIYVARKATERPEVDAFVKFYLAHSATLSEEVGYIPLPAAAVGLATDRYGKRTTGSVFDGGSKVGVTVEQLLRGA